MSRIAVIDYGMGNLHSVAKALEHVAPDADVVVTGDAKTIAESDRVLLPGVGAIRDCIAEIRRAKVDEVVSEAIASGKPFLGICVGFQALLNHSEENQGVDCLAHFDGEVKFFGDDLREDSERLKVPHMGWNQVTQTLDHPMWQGIEQDSRFYFVHSYYAKLANQDLIAGRCQYGLEFDVALAKDNVFAVQFHPEKSQHAGLTLLKNFMHWSGQ